jgi:predicted metal-dependent HD superfamily phosphohydrolase
MNKKYHTYECHIKPMLDYIDTELHLNGNGGEQKKRILKLATIFHDCVYVPMSKTNEDDSIELFSLISSEIVSTKMVKPRDREYMRRSEILKAVGIEKLRKLIKEMNSEEYHKVIELIENTKDTYNPRQGDELGHLFYLLDTFILREHYANLVKYEHRIYNEFKNHVTLDEYINGRCDFLQSAIDSIQNVNKIGLEYLIEYVKTRDYGTLGIFCRVI